MVAATLINGPLTTTFVPSADRDEFDAQVRALTGVETPMPVISEAALASADSGDVAGLAYVALVYRVSPWIVTEGFDPTATIASLTAAVDDHLRGLMALEQPDDERTLTYDIYIPEGDRGKLSLDGFERLPVEVWRRRLL